MKLSIDSYRFRDCDFFQWIFKQILLVVAGINRVIPLRFNGIIRINLVIRALKEINRFLQFLVINGNVWKGESENSNFGFKQFFF
jgi:hypothetical protein